MICPARDSPVGPLQDKQGWGAGADRHRRLVATFRMLGGTLKLVISLSPSVRQPQHSASENAPISTDPRGFVRPSQSGGKASAAVADVSEAGGGTGGASAVPTAWTDRGTRRLSLPTSATSRSTGRATPRDRASLLEETCDAQSGDLKIPPDQSGHRWNGRGFRRRRHRSCGPLARARLFVINSPAKGRRP